MKKIKLGRPMYAIPNGIVIDWNKTNREVAEYLGSLGAKIPCLITVMQLRKRLRVPALPRGNPNLKRM
jgi:hypothetical protein